MNARGAVAWISSRPSRAGTGPARRRPRRPPPLTSPALGGVAELDPDLLQDRVGVPLDHLEPSSDSTSNGVIVRVMYGTRSGASRRAPPGGRRGRRCASSPSAGDSPSGRFAHGVLLSFVSSARAGACRRRGVAPSHRPSPGRAAARPRPAARRLGRVRDPHGVDEVLLEPRLDGGLHLLDAAHDVLDLVAGGAVEQGDPAPVPAALPADVTCSGSQSGTSPSTIAWTGSMCAPNAPASRIRSTDSMPRSSISSRQPA